MILKRVIAAILAICFALNGGNLPLANAFDDADPNALAAESCIDCNMPKVPLQPGLENTIREITNATSAVPVEDMCAKKGYFFDPKNKSILQEYGLGGNGKEADALEVIARSALTCIYGLIRGGFLSIKDLVTAIPTLAGLTWKGAKYVGAAIRDHDYKATVQAIKDIDYAGWLAAMSPYNIYDKATGAYRITRDTVVDTYNRASESVFDSYQAGGATGAMAAVAQAAYAHSPHAIIGKYLKDLALKVAAAIKSEWNAFTCQDWEVMSQLVCTAVGYIAMDLLALKGVGAALGKVGRIKELISAAKARLERAPIVGNFIMKDFKAVDGSVCQGASNWMVDSRMKLQNQDIDVTSVGGKVFARGISPTTRQMGCFEVTGSAATAIAARINSTVKRANQVDEAVVPGAAVASTTAPVTAAPATAQQAALSAADLDIYSSRAAGFARGPDDFVESVNKKAGVALTGRDAKRVASALGANADELDKYGALLRSVDQLREASKTAVKGTDEGDKILRSLAHAEDGIRTLNNSLAKTASSRNVNLDLLARTYSDAALTKDPSALAVMNRALYEFNRAASKNPTKFDESVKAWEAAIKKERPHVSADELAKARQCLFPTGVK